MSAVTTQPAVHDCFACGRSFCNGDGRFCTTRCRAAFDDGFPAYQPVTARYSLPIMGDGFAIKCAGCLKTFSSKGLRCCSQECERKFVARKETVATLAEVGIEVSAKRKCQQCGGDIPRYRGVGRARREVRKDARFCSSRCSKKPALALDS